MKSSNLLLVGSALTLAITSGFAPALAQIRPQSPDYEKKLRLLVPVDDYPVADFNAPEPGGREEHALRMIRSRRHNNPNLSQSDVARFVFQEGTNPISLGLPPGHAEVESAFPVGGSVLVAVGEVTGARAYLSQDKTNVYSEFAVSVEDVVGNASTQPVAAGDVITVERPGGRVRLASGKEILRGQIGKPPPGVGRRYVFFLKSDGEARSFSITTAYELRGGKVFPLDGSSRFKKELVIREYAEYDRYAGVAEADFLTRVREALNAAPQSNNGMQRTRNDAAFYQQSPLRAADARR